MRGIWRGAVGGWGGRCGRCLLLAVIRAVVEAGGCVDGVDGQKKRPFQILRSSMVVKVRPQQRYVWREERAFSRVGRSLGWCLSATVFKQNPTIYKIWPLSSQVTSDA